MPRQMPRCTRQELTRMVLELSPNQKHIASVLWGRPRHLRFERKDKLRTRSSAKGSRFGRSGMLFAIFSLSFSSVGKSGMRRFLTVFYLYVSFLFHSGNQAALLEKMVEVLPAVAEAISGPLSKTEKMVFVGSGGAGGGGGPSQFTREMERIVAEVPETVHALTGMDLRSGIASLMDQSTKQSMVQGASEGAIQSFTTHAVSNGMRHR